MQTDIMALDTLPARQTERLGYHDDPLSCLGNQAGSDSVQTVVLSVRGSNALHAVPLRRPAK